ncbi:hypothetical protein SOVF_015410 [Spinacia oleracea]|uniref:Uncharacterized protein LOC110791615 n=1 Tax=Spinacia oleracea TaxID=3562 RepID=A0A9R0JZE9_SPIOL|nr:uncharacterized protein LOC110791615 [Spinacia oleracea]XP_021852063.1 uncharacterized protein LOC110791615 [Spinacia oleracea]XP_021852064.1 uncharacterized protein LOC110791615 [Spinacia oleracea]XP_021852065.1 uncharacterized protein LOC110791615 [Spinacia oleracea]XP_021852066.1 uncharacterized protein LOC110791615 [Spinacia oleracea]XP_021852067.1 uncharacterized protein LOC110791615 [Spinacia oleracea]XP_021852068.1 uncharacterized protein LOC110791615 [Spinacia oleracea]XP_02185206
MLVLLRRFSASISVGNPCIISIFNRYCSNSRVSIDEGEWKSYPSTSVDDGNGLRNRFGGISCLPFLYQDQPQLDSREIEVVDLDTWSIASGLVGVSKSKQNEPHLRLIGLEELDDGISCNVEQVEDDLDIDEIEDMRTHGSLFYKIEKSSMEFEEYQFDFHGKKVKSRTNDGRETKTRENLKCDLAQNGEKSLKGKVISKKSGLNDSSLVNKERLVKSIEENYVVCTHNLDGFSAGKKLRNPTFNQLTGPFHEPFCLDIYVSKGSVRACVVHRATSKVVVVAHSISKDIKFGLGSTKSRVAAATVGTVLAQRALADDIHDVIYTPRKGDKLEGKLQIVLQSIIDNGVNVKVKLKQRNPGKAVRRRYADEV